MKRIGDCEAIINKITTTIDGGVRITLDLNSGDADLVKKLMDIRLETQGLVYVAFMTDSATKVVGK